jgi:hypothetical protein
MKSFKAKCTVTYDEDTYKKGKVYEFKNGFTRREDGSLSCSYESVEEFNKRNKNSYQFELIPEIQQFTKDMLKTGDILIGEERRYKVVKNSDRPDFAIDPNGWYFLIELQPENIADWPTLKINKVIRPELAEETFLYQPELHLTLWQRLETPKLTHKELVDIVGHEFKYVKE